MKNNLSVLEKRSLWHQLRFSVCLLVAITSSHILCYSQTFTKAPYLVMPGSREMIIRWESDAEIGGVVNYGLDRTNTKKRTAILREVKGDRFLYEVTLERLKPGSRYFYKVTSGSEESEMSSFTTFSKKQPSIHFVAMGDSRSNPDIFASIINTMQEDEPELIISMGDLVARGGDMPEWDNYYFDIASNVIDHIPLVSTLGDHEGENDDGELFRHYLRTDQPTEKQWFSFDYGDAHFVSLDYRIPNSKEMANWFVQDMSSSNARWKFVYFHRPAYNLGGHRSSWGRDKWPALFSEHKVDIVFAGHSHIYERFYPMKQEQEPGSWPVTYITTGGAGAGLYEVIQHASLAVSESVNHFVNVDISGDTLNLKAIRKDHSLLDELTIIKKENVHDPAYTASVQSQERVDLLTSLTSDISLALDYVPFKSYVAPHVITLKSIVNEDIPFRIELAESSAESYKMDAFNGILKALKESQVTLEIYSNTEFITISNRGRMNPGLRLKLVYTFDSKEETVISKPAMYWPEVY